MGVRGVWTYFRRLFKRIHPGEIQALESKRIGIDMLSLIYTYKTLLDELVSFVIYLRDSGYEIICIWDGVAPKEKQEILIQRRAIRESTFKQKDTLTAYLEEYGSQLDETDIKNLTNAISSLSWQGWHLNSKKKQEIKDSLPVQHVVAEGEADDLLLEMAFNGQIDIILTLDSDLFVMGAPHIWRLLQSNGLLEKVPKIPNGLLEKVPKIPNGLLEKVPKIPNELLEKVPKIPNGLLEKACQNPKIPKNNWYIEDIHIESVCVQCGISLEHLQDAAYLAGWDRCHLTGHSYMLFNNAIEKIRDLKLQDILKVDPESHERLLKIKSNTHINWKALLKERKLI